MTPAPRPIPAPEYVVVPDPPADSGTTIGVEHVTGAGFGVVLGEAIMGLSQRYLHFKVSDFDALILGSAALSAGIGFGHALRKGGVFGLVKGFLHGWSK